MRPGEGIIVHGGAGSGRFGKEDRRYSELAMAVGAGMDVMKSGSSVDAVVAAVSYMEDSGAFNCGRGACLTSEGRMELDAAVMEGRKLAGAGVGVVTCTHSPVKLARWVMSNTEHVLIVGERAVDYAQLAGLERETLVPTRAALEKFRALSEVEEKTMKPPVSEEGNTVGAVAMDRHWVPSAAVSTGGRWLKLPGRVGDSAILGAGIFADSRSGAACATGIGEDIIKVALSLRACDLLRKGDASSSARSAISLISRLRGRGTAGIITVDRKGRVGASYNTDAMGIAWYDHEKGRVRVRI